MTALLAALLALSVAALALAYAVLRFASQRAKPLLVIGLSGVYFVGVFALFGRFASVFT